MPTLTSKMVGQLTAQGVEITAEGVALGLQYLVGEVVQKKREEWDALVKEHGLRVRAQIDATHVLFEIPEEDSDKLRDDLEQLEIEVLSDGYLSPETDTGNSVADWTGDNTSTNVGSGVAAARPNVDTQNKSEPSERTAILQSRDTYHKLGYCCGETGLTMDDGGKKVIRPLVPWSNFRTLESSMSLDNIWSTKPSAMYIVTGEASDLIVVDIDTKDGGLEAWRELCDINEDVFPNAPIARSGTGGLHYYFGLSKSIAKGLAKASNRVSLEYNGSKVGIDIRGVGGMILTPPSKYIDLRTHDALTYEWLQPLVASVDLAPMPHWLIEILNGQPKPDPIPTVREVNATTKSSTLSDLVKDRVMAILRAHGDHVSVFKRMKLDAKGHEMYVLNNGGGARPCLKNTSEVHDSNNAYIKIMDNAVLYGCHKCKGGTVVLESYPYGEWFGKSSEPPSETDERADATRRRNTPTIPGVSVFDRAVTKGLPYEYLASMYRDSYRGIAAVLARMYSKCGRVITDNDGAFYYWNGQVYVKDGKAGKLRNIFATQLTFVFGKVFARMVAEIHADDTLSEKQKTSMIQELEKKRPNFGTKNTIENVLYFAAGMMQDTKLRSKWNACSQVINCSNGVLDLNTFTLYKHHPKYRCTRMTPTPFLENANPDIAMAFFYSIMQTEEQAHFLMKLLGYSLFGHNSEQIIAIFCGVGSNGKSVLHKWLNNALGMDLDGGYFCSMDKAAILTGEKQSEVAKGGASPHLAELEGARIAMTDESDSTDRVDASKAKLQTGGICKARNLYEKLHSFAPNHTPYLNTNHRPKIDAGDEAILRRLIYVPFLNKFKTQDHIDALPEGVDRAFYRVMDAKLDTKISTEEYKESMLSVLARGAFLWTQQGLRKGMPQEFLEALNEYTEENDQLSEFIDKYCEISPAGRVQAKDFRRLFNTEYRTSHTRSRFAVMMSAKGFQMKSARVEGVKNVTEVFQGIALTGIV